MNYVYILNQYKLIQRKIKRFSKPKQQIHYELNIVILNKKNEKKN